MTAVLFAETFPISQVGLPFEREKRATIAAAVASMQIVRRHQMSGGIVSLPDKLDRSALTVVDEESEIAAGVVYRSFFPNIPVLGEERGLTSNQVSVLQYMTDPIDGTRPFKAEASTPTVIDALYNNHRKQFEAVTIGEPSTGRLWFSDGLTTRRTRVTPQGSLTGRSKECQVWDGDYKDNGLVFVENFRAFKRGERQVLTDPNLKVLAGHLIDSVNIENLGSNGAHHALVANGGTGVTGSITTSMGGEWDTGGVLAVMTAGGVAEGFRVNQDRLLERGLDPLDPFAYDMVITANNPKALQFLGNILEKSVF